MAAPLPPNVHVSQHPCLKAKLSDLRSASTNARETKALVHEIAIILGCEALAQTLTASDGPKNKSVLGHDYPTTTISPTHISLVPILRSGLGMVDALQTLLPASTPIHHLGLYREPSTLQPVEYYNNLPHAQTPPSSLAIILDPIIATGGTATAAIQTLLEWGVRKVLVLSVLASGEGLRGAAEEWVRQGEKVEVEFWVGAVDEGGLNDKGMIMPGLGDVGDRLFLTIGK
ncbi:MAG: hypothetical protein M1833_006856 [Piccolia ochrophora]|nr:MAG: hypothetical protein M1833_006856 [Piccolia ochrophora]